MIRFDLLLGITRGNALKSGLTLHSYKYQYGYAVTSRLRYFLRSETLGRVFWRVEKLQGVSSGDSSMRVVLKTAYRLEVLPLTIHAVHYSRHIPDI